MSDEPKDYRQMTINRANRLVELLELEAPEFLLRKEVELIATALDSHCKAYSDEVRPPRYQWSGGAVEEQRRKDAQEEADSDE